MAVAFSRHLVGSDTRHTQHPEVTKEMEKPAKNTADVKKLQWVPQVGM
jgi:hypothetical protein